MVTRAANADRPDPLDWIETSRVRSSPLWKTSRILAETLEPEVDAPWYARLAWVNLYPAAPEAPPDNPGGALREAQDFHVGKLLRAVVDTLDARRVIALVGPFWWPAGDGAGLRDLAQRPRPLLRAGLLEHRTWVVGWHPNGASHRGWGPHRYAEIIADAIGEVEAARGG